MQNFVFGEIMTGAAFLVSSEGTLIFKESFNVPTLPSLPNPCLSAPVKYFKYVVGTISTVLYKVCHVYVGLLYDF